MVSLPARAGRLAAVKLFVTILDAVFPAPDGRGQD